MTNDGFNNMLSKTNHSSTDHIMAHFILKKIVYQVMEHSICLLDANVQTLLDIQVHPLVRTINLHGNVIRRIQNLASLHNLRHLDLSANRITLIEGLESLLMLRTLNLSYNFIQKVDGLKSLRCLVSINLSYNRITDLSGFREIGGPKYQLQQISVHGNCIQSTSHVIQCLRACTTLCELVLKHENSGNPLCDTPGYTQTILNGLPWLRVLDGSDRSGRSVPLCEEAMQGPIADIDPYLDYLVPSSDTKIDGPNLVNNNNGLSPKLDDCLDRYCLRNIVQNSSNHSPLIEEEDIEAASKDLHNLHDLEFRPASAGRRTASLKRNRHLSRSSPALESVRDGFSATSTRLTVSTVMDYSTIQRCDHIPSLQRHPMLSKTSESTQSSSSSSEEKNLQPTRRSTPNLRMKRRVNRRDVAYESDSTTDLTEGGENYRISRTSLPRSIRQRRKNSKGSKRNFRSTSAIPHEPNDSSDNPGQEAAIQRALISPHHLNRKDDDPTTILICRSGILTDDSLMKELDVERELRWRAEQAANKLSEQVQQLHNYRGYPFNEQNLQETALVVTDRLKQALMHERDVRARIQTDFDMIKDKNKELSQRLQEAEAVEEDLRHTQRAMETSVTKLEAEKMKHHSQQARLAQEAQLKASALAQEVEHLKTSIRALKAQVHQLQNLLAAREQEHRQEMESRLSSGKKDIQEAVAKEIGKETSRYEIELNQQQDRVEQLQRKYLELEDEFQVAIHVEVTRYKELTAVYLQLQEAYVAVSEELNKRKQSTVAAHDKERESAAVMMELTSVNLFAFRSPACINT
uniref:Leucine-rich repeat and coiled-coil domain-containing protein 1 n=1 Tax=Strigamia maritima TaxID=126957 RepID=T1IUU6_STRMM